MHVIAGVSGHVGSVAAKALLERKQPVRVVVRDAKKGDEWSKRGAEVAVASLDDRASLERALAGGTSFFTLIPPKFDETDFLAYQRAIADAVAAAVKASRVGHVVLLSSVGADLPDGTGPIKGLHYQENVLRATGTKLTSIRAGYFQENVGSVLPVVKGQGIFPSLLASTDLPFPRIASKDVGAAVADALARPPARSENVDVQGPVASEAQVAALFGKLLGKPVQLVQVPAEGRVAALLQAGMSRSLAELYAEMIDAFGRGVVMPHGDRIVEGKTPIEETLRTLLG